MTLMMFLILGNDSLLSLSVITPTLVKTDEDSVLFILGIYTVLNRANIPINK